jgi:hypothetical protein
LVGNVAALAARRGTVSVVRSTAWSNDSCPVPKPGNVALRAKISATSVGALYVPVRIDPEQANQGGTVTTSLHGVENTIFAYSQIGGIAWIRWSRHDSRPRRRSLLTRRRDPAVRWAAGSKATFALIIGANKSVDENLAPLKYADDDAARYFDLFRLLGARTYLLSRLDENTQRLHPQTAAETDEPKRAAFDRAAADLARDVAQASARGLSTVVYIVYAGHGDVKNGQGYITLEDARVGRLRGGGFQPRSALGCLRSGGCRRRR